MCLHEHHLENLKKLNYIPVGLGKNHFSNQWVKDNENINISQKNPFYGEYTFYYWFWKNVLKEIDDNTWIGFAGYRYHWSNSNKFSSDEISKQINQKNFSDHILKNIPNEWTDSNVILGEEIFIDNWKFSKILKHGKKIFLKNPKFFFKKNRNIKLHFDVFHGQNILDKAIDVLNQEDRNDFKDFVNQERSFNRENLFFCRSKKIMNDYFSSVFNWLFECEKIFGFDLEGYGQKRLYAFLAERYISFWFKKYTKPKTWPIFFYDTNKNKIAI
tara:strand:- start:5061 stop:5876 length:816 start_codon:yes stop_codon:yes gene_type:complete